MTKILRASERGTAPWKNGGGVTRQIAAFPPESDLDSFLWRISTAEILVGGPFSSFAAVDRVIAVLNGVLQLRFESGAVTLTHTSEPLHFPGDAPVVGEPLNGPVLDLNVMIRRGAGGATLLRLDQGASVSQSCATLVAIAASSSLIEANQAPLALNALDAALFHDARDGVEIAVPTGTVYLACFARNSA